MISLQNFAQEHPVYWWWVQDVAKLSDRIVCEGIFNYGTFEQKLELSKFLGREQCQAFLETEKQAKRSSLRPETVSYWLMFLERCKI